MDHAMHATMTAMLVLMIPAFFICLGIAIVAYRKRGAGGTNRGR
jgi:hypothetical protein